ncbi:MAG TPA: acetyl-CoA hydrolase/transferase C-terminal domain-containing protein, partial [Candidatus Sulfomarinibacteraceae bacterium]|nr:acetyl-CoA hydrolase/transferase C-terminal domain-containing protein [Candidatus Sulfomarinibacteraceae bacterium]
MNWVEIYRRRTTTADQAVRDIRSGDRVWVHPGCNTPVRLIDAMVARAPELENVEVVHILTLAEAPYVAPGMEPHFRHRALFTGANVRAAVNEGRADFVPIHLHQVPSLITDGLMPVDVALVHLSPPDEHGFCSFGVGVDATKAAVENARTVIALVNQQMPRALGDSFVHVSKLTHVVEVDEPVLELSMAPEVSEVARRIGENIASLIPDGATLQMGIGEIPDAVLLFLGDKKHLGVHTEMFSDGLVGLFEAGVVTNEKKTLHRGKIVASFVIGSRRAFDFVDNNPFMEFHPNEYVNDPFIVAQNERMVAINSAISVDLTGQVCADSIGTRIYSGFGGQLDFIRGAARSKGGVPIIALPSTARDGAVSRLVDTLLPGSGVVTTRADVHYVVTEYGIANLWGRSLR